MQATISSQPAQLSAHSTSSQSVAPPLPRPSPPVIFVILCGIVWPLGTLIVEMVSGMSAEIWIDPIPSLWHVGTIAFVPFLNAYLLFQLLRGKPITPTMLLASALAIGITAVYWALFIHWGLIGILLFWMGIGLLPMAPMMTCIATIRLFRFMSRHHQTTVTRSKIGLGIAAGISFLLMLEIPTICAGLGLTLAAKGVPEQRETGLRLLKFFGEQKEVARFASGEVAHRFQFASELAASVVGLESPSREDAQQELYRATGKPLENLHKTRRGWDQDRAAAHVGAVLPGLGLAESRLEIVAQPEENLTYTEWTMKFANDYSFPQEARSEVQLPPGGVVSRLTLWVNGEPREAAFAGQSQVRAAYTAIVARSQDPVLITMTAPGRVLVQCFPVPAKGTMQIRVGITAPLIRESEESARYVFPTFTHQNFRNETASSALVYGSTGLDGFRTVTADAKSHLEKDVVLSDQGITPSFLMPVPQPKVQWARDTRAAEKRYIVQTATRTEPARKPWIIVIDGSQSLRRLSAELARQLADLKDARIIVAGKYRAHEIAGKDLRTAIFEGGADNVIALEEALEIGAATGIANILWIHGPQPVALTPIQSLNDRLQKHPNARLVSLQVAAGRNAILEQLKPGSEVESIPLTDAPNEVVAETLAKLRGEVPVWQTKYDVSAQKPAEENGEGKSLHVVRLWANEKIRELTRGGFAFEAVRMAQRYQLVTPVSGAVVLETAKQFEEAGLKPVDLDTTPTVPEPGTIALLVVGSLVLIGHRKFRRAMAR